MSEKCADFAALEFAGDAVDSVVDEVPFSGVTDTASSDVAGAADNTAESDVSSPDTTGDTAGSTVDEVASSDATDTAGDIGVAAVAPSATPKVVSDAVLEVVSPDNSLTPAFCKVVPVFASG